jgi:two-component system, sporulation sensor kinase E
MNRKQKSFDDRFLSKIGKIDRSHIREYLAQTLSQKQFLETLFDRLDEGILVTDAEFRIIHSNRVARRLLQWPRNKFFLGEPLPAHCPDGELRVLLERMRVRPHPIEARECAFGPDGDRRLVLKAIPMEPADEDERMEGDAGPMWVFLLQDVTERYRTIEEHARAQRLSSLALLTAGIAHEIKNPLNSLNIHAEILLKESQAGDGEPLDREKVARAASVILEETERLTEIVNVFIQAARPQGPILEKHSINRVCEDIVRVLGPECEQAGVQLRAEFDPDLPLMLLDIHLMFQALRNLVRNALEAHQEVAAGRPGSRSAGEEEPAGPAIVLRTRLAGDAVNIEVIDNGPGIPEDKLDKIFEPYYTTKFDGTGLGLMVVYRVVTEHQGVIHVDSRPGLGTRFKITLPMAERPLRLLEEPSAAPAAGVS